jgi:Fuc2NAc and GlcNAc transferase
MNSLLLFFFILIISLFLTEFIRRYSVKKNLLDTPNYRSSHSIATPRGGGLSIVTCFLVVIGFSVSLPNNTVFAFIGSGALAAVVGFWDDQGHIAARWRLLFHFIAAIWVLYWFGGLPELEFIGLSINLGWFGFVIVAFALVWLLNLFNFMDGIDGIAASETIFVAGAGAYFSWLNGLDDLSFISLVLASSTFGFLILNWAPAKIFMGDVGSGFLGLMLGIIAYIGILQGMLVWTWLILFAVFIADSGLTLLRRVISGDKWYEAHCSHAYQHAARKWGHKKVTLSVIGINLFALFPLALLVHYKPELGFLLTLLTFVLLVAIALKFKAGITVN